MDKYHHCAFAWIIVLVLWTMGGTGHADAPVTTAWFGSPSPAPDESASWSAASSDPSPCPRPVTVFRRMPLGRERVRMALLACDGTPRQEALEALSILARPRAVEERPTEEAIRAWRDGDGDPDWLTAEVRRLHPALLDRLQRIGEAFPERPIEIVSGHRPHSPRTSRHHHARALDLRVIAVPREEVRDLAVTLRQTGVGWYPNSVFVHIDVRHKSTYWVDLSGPGEAPRYVRGAEPPPEDVPPPTTEELEAIRRDTDDILRQIRVSVD